MDDVEEKIISALKERGALSLTQLAYAYNKYPSSISRIILALLRLIGKGKVNVEYLPEGRAKYVFTLTESKPIAVEDILKELEKPEELSELFKRVRARKGVAFHEFLYFLVNAAADGLVKLRRLGEKVVVEREDRAPEELARPR